MPGTRVVAYDTWPVSDYVVPFEEWAERFAHLYYCRECVRNFETEIRVAICPYCEKKNIVELPKGQTTRIKKAKSLAERLPRILSRSRFSKKKITKEEVNAQIKITLNRIHRSLIRFRVWLIYVTTTVLDDELR